MFWQTAYMQPQQPNAVVPYNQSISQQRQPSIRPLYNANGYNTNGYNTNGYNTNGYNTNGYNTSGYNTSGYKNSWQGGHYFNQHQPVVVQQNRNFNQPHQHPYRNSYSRGSFNCGSSSKSVPQIPNKDNRCRCSPCDREFTSLTALQAHQKMHVKCEQDGCSFVASSKAVKLHFIQTHAEGKFRICLQTPEEITKWKEERKRNWPSAENIARKKQKQLDDKRDGILIETKEFSYTDRKGNHGNRNGNIRERGRGRNRRKNKNQAPIVPIGGTEVHAQSRLVEENGAKPTFELQQTTIETGQPEVVKEATVTGLSLLQSYEGDVTDVEKELVNQNDDDLLKNSEDSHEALLKSSRVDREEGEVESEPEPVQFPLDGHQNTEERAPTANPDFNNNSNLGDGENTIVGGRKASKKLKKQQKREQRGEIKRKVSLLEMLLANEIRHERNVILQCIRYTVKENFFDS